jgi:hypothetical protein
MREPERWLETRPSAPRLQLLLRSDASMGASDLRGQTISHSPVHPSTLKAIAGGLLRTACCGADYCMDVSRQLAVRVEVSCLRAW